MQTHRPSNALIAGVTVVVLALLGLIGIAGLRLTGVHSETVASASVRPAPGAAATDDDVDVSTAQTAGAEPPTTPPPTSAPAPTGETLDEQPGTATLTEMAVDRGPAGASRSGTSVPVAATESVVAVGAGDLVLTDADIDVQLDEAGQLAPGTTGVASFEFPTSGPLAGAVLDQAVRGRVGVATGAELAHLGAHLRDEQRYFYADLGSQAYDLDLRLDDAHTGATALPERISTAGDVSGSSMFVASIDADYFYLSTPCAAMIPAGSDTSSGAGRRSDAESSEIPGVSADLSAFDPSGCGIGWSVGGYVPFISWMDDRMIDIPADFGAHMVVDGTIPIHPSASLDGELFYRFDPDRAVVWANGELDIGVSFHDGAAEVRLPAVRGTFGLDVTPTDFGLWVTATAGSDAADGSPTQLLADLAPIRGTVDLDGELHISDGIVLDRSFFQLAGDVSIAPTAVRSSSGVETADVLAADGLVRIDAAGVMARGSVAASPLPDLDLSGSAELEFFVPFVDPLASYLEMRGALAVGGTAIGADAELRIDRDGARARGAIDVAGLTGLDVEGWLGPDGFQLTGAIDATLPIGDLDQVAASLVDETDNARVLQLLNAQIDERVNEIGAADPAKGTELRNTIADMRVAFTDIASVRETIAYNDGLIEQLWLDHQADIDWHWALNDFDRFWDKGPHAIRLAAILVEIEALKAANSVQYAYIDVANTVVSTTQQLVLAIIGWDEELNALLALQTEAYVSTLAGNFVSTVLNGADAVLDAFGVDGSAVGTVTFTLGTEGLAATADLQWCRDGACETIVGATVTLSPVVQVCATLVGIPACVEL